MINTLYPPTTVGGAERSVRNLARALVARGHQVAVAALHAGEDACQEDDHGVAVHRLPLRNKYWPFDREDRPGLLARAGWHWRDRANAAATHDLAQLIDSFRADVVHSNNLTGFSPGIWDEAKSRGIRTVHTLRDMSLLCARGTMFRNGRDCVTRCAECRVLKAGMAVLTTRLDAVAANSRYTLEAHVERGYFAGVRSDVIFNIAAAADAKAQFDRGSDDLVFGFLGRIEPEKGIEVLLAATRLLPATGWQLQIAGTGDRAYVDALKRNHDDPRIDWLGFRPADKVYDAIDVTVIPSIWPEPLPRTIVESLVRGLPAIYSDAGGTDEAGRLMPLARCYPRADAAALAAAMREAIGALPRWRGAPRASDEIIDRFGANAITDRYLRLYCGAARLGDTA